MKTEYINTKYPLHLAIERKNYEDVKLLIKNKFNLNQKDNFGVTPLVLAIQKNNIDIIKLLIESGAKIEEQDISINNLEIRQFYPNLIEELMHYAKQKEVENFFSNEIKYQTMQEALKAVKEYGGNLAYVKWELRNDYDIVLAAVQEYAEAYNFASKELQFNYDIVLATLKKNGYMLSKMHAFFQKDKTLQEIAQLSINEFKKSINN
jgi:ankyrin repeat protein